MPKTESFEKYSDEYDEWFEKNPDIYEAELEAIRQLIPSSEAIGLEVGVGSGRFADPLGIKIGVEPSGKMALKAEKRGIRVFPGVAENLPFSNGAFDFVLMVTAICFVDDLDKSFREAFRVLNPGGCIIVGFLDRKSGLGKKYGMKSGRSKFYKEATFFSTEEVLKYLEDARFVNVQIKQAIVPGEPPGTVLDDFGKGSFVVVRSMKQAKTR